MLESDDPDWCGAWNFGPQPGQEFAVAQLVARFLAAWGDGAWEDVSGSSSQATEDRSRPRHESRILRLNIDKSMTRLGWRPAWNAAEAVARTARWYRRFYERGHPKMLGACHEDIEAYGASCIALHAWTPAASQSAETPQWKDR
jgi:CDP-glucose 4,6-dehydratase